VNNISVRILNFRILALLFVRMKYTSNVAAGNGNDVNTPHV